MIRKKENIYKDQSEGNFRSEDRVVDGLSSIV